MYICSTQKQKSNDDHSINGSRLCDGGFYAQSTFKTAIAKPVL